MFDIYIFNSVQIADQLISFYCVYLLTSVSAKTRFFGFVVGTIGFVPAITMFYLADLWWILVTMPIWVYINYRGLVNNWREFRAIKVNS